MGDNRLRPESIDPKPTQTWEQKVADFKDMRGGSAAVWTGIEIRPCRICGDPTDMKECHGCWELETRIKGQPDLAAKILERVRPHADAARLDWLHERMTGDYSGGLAHCWRDIGIDNGAVTLRDAIDRAMKAER